MLNITNQTKNLIKTNIKVVTKLVLSDCNGIRTHNYLARKQTLNHLAKLTKYQSVLLTNLLLLLRSLSNITFSFSLYVRCPSTILKLLQDSLKLAFFLSFPKIRFFISKTFDFLFKKKRCSLKLSVLEFQKYKKT